MFGRKRSITLAFAAMLALSIGTCASEATAKGHSKKHSKHSKTSPDKTNPDTTAQPASSSPEAKTQSGGSTTVTTTSPAGTSSTTTVTTTTPDATTTSTTTSNSASTTSAGTTTTSQSKTTSVTTDTPEGTHTSITKSSAQTKTKSDPDEPKGIHVPKATPKNAPLTSWLPPEGVRTRAALLCIHGFSLHRGCYAAFGKEMAKSGIATYAHDLRGFGELKDKAEHGSMDFDGIMVDTKAVLEQIHKNHPGLPVVILGESMGGSVALRAVALYPSLTSGLIAAVPARDRFSMSGGEVKVTFKSVGQTLTGGFSKRMDNVAHAAVQKISAKEDVRANWTNDPLMRTDFSPKEFVQFDRFMADNLDAAPLVKTTPVLFIQGTDDKLIRPAGTWKLYERLKTPNRQIVLSKNSEHLIFEEGQFKPEDISFVTTWIDKNIAPLDPKIANFTNALPVVASKEQFTGNEIALAEAETGAMKDVPKIAAAIPPAPAPKPFEHKLAAQTSPQINFWIELYRNGKVFRCNNKTEFKSGDAIRFHLIPGTDGYAYLVMKAGTTGKSDVLFPKKEYGTHNYLTHGQDYTIPDKGWMQFDSHPGTEQLGLVFANQKVDVTPESLKNRTLTAFVSTEKTGSKDLCPTRMKLSWDDPTPVMIPEDFSGVSQLANASDSSLVRLMSAGGMVSASIQLMHGN